MHGSNPKKTGGVIVMTSDGDFGNAARTLTAQDEVQGVLSGAFYAPPAKTSGVRPKSEEPERPLNYKVICISMYNDDLGQLDRMVDELKGRGVTKANRSALIRHALSQLDMTKIPRSL